MTERKRMTQEEKRIKIAEACGWTRVKPMSDGSAYGFPPDEDGRRESRNSGCDPEIPDYFNDLNAMHEAEKTLWGRNDWSACRYQETLQTRVMATESWTWHATAPQRAEAFGITLDLWKYGE